MDNDYSQTPDSSSLPRLAVTTLIISLIIFFAYVVKDIFDATREGTVPKIVQLTNYFVNLGENAGELKSAVEKQQYADEEFANFEKRVAGKFPWRNKLPLTSVKYFVFFDIIIKQFTGRIYPDNDDNVRELEAEATRRLKKEKNIPLEKYIMDWDMWPRSALDPY